MTKDNKWTRFANEVSFKGMTANNKAVLEYIAHNQHSSGCVLTFRQIGAYADITKQSAKNNVKKLEKIGLIKTAQESYTLNCKLPLNFKINLSWKENTHD